VGLPLRLDQIRIRSRIKQADHLCRPMEASLSVVSERAFDGQEPGWAR